MRRLHAGPCMDGANHRFCITDTSSSNYTACKTGTVPTIIDEVFSCAAKMVEK